MRSPEDLVVVARPSPVNVRNLIVVVGVLLLGIIGVGFRNWAIERKVRRQTAELATLEHQRSQILEDINGTRPLADILEEIAQMVSLQLHGAPCWCQIADGARLGNFPPQATALRCVEEKIVARTGPPLGAIFAGFSPLTKPSTRESEALSMGAGLATLAIETRKMYSDLLHRSEFDLLTDIHNRFFMDQYLDLQIEASRTKAGIFGLIYIDLDRFKEVNDQHGHEAGDLYLKEATNRMQGQLRAHDLLARLGGDEFAVLVPVVRNRAEVKEIARRLEHSFDAPFVFEEFTIQGAASVGVAVYPEDGTTKDSLLRAADAAMYVAKNAKHQLQ
jgi:diguanylate cyclase (GGDEF)-like protein